MSDGLTMWQMYVIFAFGQCKHVNSSMMSDLQWYWWLFITATIFYFALYLHCISLVIALHVQLQLKRGYEILLVCL